MAKLTQFGRMRRRIKRELDAARAERVLAITQTAGILAAGVAQVQAISNTIVTAKMLRAWIGQRAGELPEDIIMGSPFPAEPITTPIVEIRLSPPEVET